ncbi:hypothetical protein C8J57DRAFT_51492 [Mycena rebaudengoi]|nr:hypothetical protein C8J57DRAFT_51492 [Mycena rebaudengoi]
MPCTLCLFALLAFAPVVLCQSATRTTTSKKYYITPPVSCPGVYWNYAGVCCGPGIEMVGCTYPDRYSNAGPESCCPPGNFWWSLPLSDASIAAAKANGTYSGCPGNMRLGVCCSGAIIYEDDSGNDVCSSGTVVFVASTLADGSVKTSMAPSGTTSAAGGITSNGQSGTTQTGAGATPYPGLDMRILGGAAMALGVVL